MLATTSAIDQLQSAVTSARAFASSARGDDAAHVLAAVLRAADALTQSAVALLQRLKPSGDLERATGLSDERLVSLDARRPSFDARALTHAADALRAMPATSEAFQRGLVSWAHVRSIVAAVRTLNAEERAAVDRVVAVEAARDGEPDRLLQRVDEEVERVQARRTQRNEDRDIERGFLVIQPFLGGWGGRIYAEADAESFATICEAIDVHAPRPTGLDEPDTPPRAQQRLEGLVRVCESALAGGATGRPRPRFIATIDLAQLEADPDHAARLLWRARGHGRATRVATDTLFCDAEMQPVVFDGARPIAVADVVNDPTPKVRAALIARDGGCRFPTCDAPVTWTDVHHINGRGYGRTASIDDLVMLCRRCHRHLHRYTWKVTVNADGSITFRYRGREYVSHPRIRGPARE